MRFTLDWRLHKDESLLTKQMDRLQGPAIHIIFDAALSKKEWSGLRNLENKWVPWPEFCLLWSSLSFGGFEDVSEAQLFAFSDTRPWDS